MGKTKRFNKKRAYKKRRTIRKQKKSRKYHGGITIIENELYEKINIVQNLKRKIQELQTEYAKSKKNILIEYRLRTEITSLSKQLENLKKKFSDPKKFFESLITGNFDENEYKEKDIINDLRFMIFWYKELDLLVTAKELIKDVIEKKQIDNVNYSKYLAIQAMLKEIVPEESKDDTELEPKKVHETNITELYTKILYVKTIVRQIDQINLYLSQEKNVARIDEFKQKLKKAEKELAAAKEKFSDPENAVTSLITEKFDENEYKEEDIINDLRSMIGQNPKLLVTAKKIIKDNNNPKDPNYSKYLAIQEMLKEIVSEESK